MTHIPDCGKCILANFIRFRCWLVYTASYTVTCIRHESKNTNDAAIVLLKNIQSDAQDSG